MNKETIIQRQRGPVHPGRPLTLSRMDPELEEWAREETKRRTALHLPRPHFFEVVNDGLRALRDQCLSIDRFYYLDGQGPFFSILECLDALGVPQEERGKYWHRWDRLPQDYQARIQVAEQAGGAVAVQEEG